MSYHCASGENMTFKAVIIEDEENSAAALAMLLQVCCPEVQVMESCRSIPQGVLAIHKFKPDIVFLDIEMPVYSGFELFKFIPEPEFSVIFTTAYSQYAIKAFEVSAVDYLLKPIEADALVAAVKKASIKQEKELIIKKMSAVRENVESEKLKKIALPISDGLAFVEIETIEYFEAEGVYTRIFFKDKSQIFISKNIKVFEDILCKHDHFLRIHRSHLVNSDFILNYHRGEGLVNMASGATLRIARDKKQWFEDTVKTIRLGNGS